MKRLWKGRLFILNAAILILHSVILYAIAFAPAEAFSFKAKKMIVHTHTARPPSSKSPPSSAVKPASAKKSAPSAPKESVSAKKAPEKKSVPSKKQEVKAKKAPAAPNKSKPSSLAPLIVELEERIAKIEKNHDKVSDKSKVETILPQNPGLSVEKLPSFDEIAASLEGNEDLIGFLHESLQLPDFGKVKVKMTISSSGVVNQVVIVESESVLNSKYLEEHLLGLRLPFVDKSFFKGNEKSFVINFCNEL